MPRISISPDWMKPFLGIALILSVFLPTGCDDGLHDRSFPHIQIHMVPQHEAVFSAFMSTVPGGNEMEVLQVSEAPEKDLLAGEEGSVAAALVADLDCDSCYRIDRREDGAFVIHGDFPLGLQYGLAHLLELHGVRFFHPWYTYAPPSLALLEGAEDIWGQQISPQIARRGMQLHTLHPIEALFDFWVPSEEGLEGAERTMDWLIKNRGNYLQWPALDDIQSDEDTLSAWVEHTRSILEYGHLRGLQMGFGFQLFGSSNLQQAFDLVDGNATLEEMRQEIKDRLLPVTSELDFDVYNVSFGEFFGADAQELIDSVNIAWEVIQEIAPGVEVPATIHVGEFEDLMVEYQGQEVQYYFLIQFADPGFTPWVHTVMYYNLYEDAGGAYGHDDFSEHRQFLLDEMASGQEVGYFPETAYWVAFDISVPQYLPLYIRSRHTDLAGLAASGVGPLPQHILFSSGWEWGYWQNDVTSLRMSHTLPPSWEEEVTSLFLPLGEAGTVASQAIIDLAEIQHRHLIEDRLTAYIAGRDVIIDLGFQIGVWSQPDRPSFAEVAVYDESQRQEFSTTLEGLDSLATETEAILASLNGLDWGSAAAVGDELKQGVEIDALRARYIASLYRGAWEKAGGGTGEPELKEAAGLLATAGEVVNGRHAHLWDPGQETLITRVDNPTIYDFGYLYQAEQLCYWNREMIQMEELILGKDGEDPGCAL